VLFIYSFAVYLLDFALPNTHCLDFIVLWGFLVLIFMTMEYMNNDISYDILFMIGRSKEKKTQQG
jgi:hypothetical protein